MNRYFQCDSALNLYFGIIPFVKMELSLTKQGDTLMGLWHSVAFPDREVLSVDSGSSTVTTELGRDFIVAAPDPGGSSRDQVVAAHLVEGVDPLGNLTLQPVLYIDPDPVALPDYALFGYPIQGSVRVYFGMAEGGSPVLGARKAPFSDVCTYADDAWSPSSSGTESIFEVDVTKQFNDWEKYNSENLASVNIDLGPLVPAL